MKINKKYSFQDWLKGKFAFDVAPIVFDSELYSINDIVIVNKNDLEKHEFQMILKEQKVIFKRGVNEFQNFLKATFKSSFKNSQIKKVLLNKEIRKTKSILIEELPNLQDYVTISDAIFDFQQLQEIKNYYKYFIIGGNKFDYNIIHNDNFKFKSEGIQYAIYAQGLFEHLKWLISLKTTIENNLKRNEQLKDEDINDITAPKKNKEDTLWFKVGLLFANGKMDDILKKNSVNGQPNFRETSRELKNLNYRPYISESYSGSNIKDKNIFSNIEKVDFIINYCKNHNITVVQSFSDRVNNSVK